MSAIRSLDHVDLPAPGVWTIDPGHAEVAFIGRHFGLTKVRGRFTGIDGTVNIADDPADSEVAVTIDMATVNSGDNARDDHLRSEDLFDVLEHPQATFRSTQLDVAGTSATMVGDLTIKAVTRPVTLNVDYLGHVTDPWGGERAVLSANGKLNREDWGLTWNMFLEAGGVVVSKEIRIEIEVELVLQTA